MKQVKNNSLVVRVNKDESAMIRSVASEMDMSQSSLVLFLVDRKSKALQRKRHALRHRVKMLCM